MKPILPFIVLLVLLGCKHTLYSQYYIAGDTSQYHAWIIGQTYIPNDTVDFDLNCDGLVDLSFTSIDGNLPGFPWDRLTMDLGEGVEVCNSGTSFVTGFEEGDTIPYNNAYWTSSLDFIYGKGAVGSYGQAAINNKYLAFRIINTDTMYTYIRFSNQFLVFTIHEMLSSCQESPLITGITEYSTPLPVFSPNPFTNECRITNVPANSHFEILDVFGKIILAGNGDYIQMAGCAPGLYYVRFVPTNGTGQVHKLVKW